MFPWTALSWLSVFLSASCHSQQASEIQRPESMELWKNWWKTSAERRERSRAAEHQQPPSSSSSARSASSSYLSDEPITLSIPLRLPWNHFQPERLEVQQRSKQPRRHFPANQSARQKDRQVYICSSFFTHWLQTKLKLLSKSSIHSQPVNLHFKRQTGFLIHLIQHRKQSCPTTKQHELGRKICFSWRLIDVQRNSYK